MNFAAKEIPLSGRGERLVLDVAQNVYRLAYYRPARDPQTYEQIGEERITHKDKSLLNALRVVFLESDSPHDPETIEHYIRSSSWGRGLP